MANIISIYRGNDASWKVTLTNSDGSAYSLTDCHLDLYVKEKVTDLTSEALIHKDSDVSGEFDIDSPATLGTATMKFVPNDTKKMHIKRNYYFDIELLTAGGKTFTIMRGKFTLKSD